MNGMDYSATVRLANTDAAGRLFFADMFVLAHEAWEACLDTLGFGVQDILKQGEFLTPIVHAESDFCAPVSLGSEIGVSVTCPEVGTTSFTIAFEAKLNDGTLAARLKHVHATIDAATGEPIPVPVSFQELLAQLNTG
jgi:1,4-dihydroxy-2-naphthoyl-CoA hydrolase